MSDQKHGGGLGGFFSKIGLTENVPDAPPRNTPVPAQPPGVAPTTHAVPPVPMPWATGPASGPTPWSPAPVQAITADPGAIAELESRLKKAYTPPYAAFMEQYQALSEDIPDERQRFRVALKTSHATADQVLQGIDLLLNAMEQAHTDFSKQFEAMKGSSLSQAEQAVKASDDLIAQNEEQIRTLQEHIAALRTKRETDQTNMQHEAVRLDGIRGGFEAAMQQVLGGLNTFKSRIAAIAKA